MTGQATVAQVATYLAQAGWQPEPERWNGATIWSQGGAEVLVPPSDDLGDTPARVRELLRCLEAVEGRPAATIAREMRFPLLDSASYRTVDADRAPGFVRLTTGVRAVTGIRDLVGAAARATVEGPRPRFRGAPPAPVLELLDQVQVGVTPSDRFALTLLVPVTASAAENKIPIGRQVLLQLQDAAAAVERAARAADVTAFDETVPAGVSAEFCRALGELAGPEHEQPFEIGFRWAVGLPAPMPNRVIGFPPQTAALLRAASDRLISLDAPTATVIGRVQDLHDDPEGGRRWRARVRGKLRRAGLRSARRTIWVQLDSQSSYDVVLAAHRDGVPVRIDGTIVDARRQDELLASPGGIQLDQRDDDL